MNISVFGLGYVGCITAGSLAKKVHELIGVDVGRSKVRMIHRGQTPINEEGLGELIKDVVERRFVSATVDEQEAVLNTELSMIRVGTPSTFNRELDGRHLENVFRSIGKAAISKDSFHAIVIRSTVGGDIVTSQLIPILEQASGKVMHRDFGIAINPEFLR